MGVHWHRHRDSQRPLSQQRRRIGGIGGGGATPLENGFKWGIAGSPTAFIVGTYGSDEGEFLTAYCYKHPSLANSFAIFNENGVLLQGGQGRNEHLEQMMISSIKTALGVEVEHIVLLSCPVAIGETLPQWEQYERV